MNLFEAKGFEENVFNAEHFDGCLLCKKKYKSEKETPVGKECEKRLKDEYRFAVINIQSGCHERVDAVYTKKELQKYFGTSNDFVVACAGWGGFTAEWLWKEGYCHFNEDDWGYDESTYDEKSPDELELITIVTGKTKAKLICVHEDIWGLGLVQHSDYLGPAKSWAEYEKVYGQPYASCYCCSLWDTIKERAEELEFELKRYEELSYNLRFSVIERIDQELKDEQIKIDEIMHDVRLWNEGKGQEDGCLTGWCYSLSNWFDFEMKIDAKPKKQMAVIAN